MNNWRTWSLSCVLGCLLSAGALAQTPEGNVAITFLHCNDVHGTVDAQLDPKVCSTSLVGGLANLKSLLDQERQVNPQATLVFNGGDLAEGTLLSYLTRGQSYCRALSLFKFDAITLGNHDFAWGQANLHKMLDSLDSPVVLANVQNTADGTGLAETVPYVVKEVKGVKIAVLGLDTPNIFHFVTARKLEGLDFRKAVQTVKWYLPVMRRSGADIVVVLSHLGYEQDVKLAESVPEIDVIVGAHSHTALQQGRVVGRTLIVQAGSQTKYLGRVDLEYNLQSRAITKASARLVPVIANDLKPCPEVEKILAPYRAEAEAVGAKAWTVCSEDVLYSHREAAKLNQIHADTLWQTANSLQKAWPGFDEPGGGHVEFAICNSRTLRGSLPAGTVPYRTVYASLPFTEENLVTMQVTGQAVIDEIEDDLCDKATELVVPAGLTYEYDGRLPEKHRLVKVTLSDGTPLEAHKTYLIAANETMSRKAAFKEAVDKRILCPVQPLYFEALQKLAPLTNNPDRRVVRLDK